ncbi:ABC-type transport auxiliary lipoprotein family protein [Thalassobaculum sp.]|jgi:cholesterol transport system auxiliary component|uniref:ABC-type transport auxiliary lipoprotein family protein n=1 Tax=Thalassobaculum sp. TaxID=2022740 RepID=UPI003B5A607C
MTELPRRTLLAQGLAAAGLAGLTAACSQLPIGRPPPQLYTLTPKSTYPADLPQVPWQLAIERPSAPAGLSSARIAVAREPLTLDYYAGVAWVDDAPNMVQRLLVESFENSNRIIGVGREGVSFRSDYTLKVELREFQAEYFNAAATPTINVRINVKMVQMPQRTIIASQGFDTKRPAPSNRMSDIVQTFDAALGIVLRDVVIWTLRLS